LPAVIQTFCHYEIADVFMHLTDFIGFYIGYNIFIRISVTYKTATAQVDRLSDMSNDMFSLV